MCAICLTTSCSDSGDTLQDTGSAECAIGFSASLDNDGSGVAYALGSRATRAVGDGEFGLDPVNTNQELQESGFGVYCWYTAGDDFSAPSSSTFMLMRNQKVEYSSPQWTYSPPKYWPLEPSHKLTFRAYAPYVNYSLVESVVSDPEHTYVAGMPLLPVVVSENDYNNGTQHDPLWGTGRLVQGLSDATPGEYFPEPDPSATDQSKSRRYGQLYNNMTLQMSGDKRLTSDSRDGIIDWYFHHGMSCLMFNISITPDPGCDYVTIKGIKIEPLYKQGLLDISSPTADSSEKPWWYDRSEDITVGIDETSLATLGIDPYNPHKITINTNLTEPTGPIPLLSHGLLIIPRSYDSSTPMTVEISYTVDDDTEVQKATGTINNREFKGNTIYTLGLSLTPETRGVEIDVVESAFTPWREGDSGSHIVYNW